MFNLKAILAAGAAAAIAVVATTATAEMMSVQDKRVATMKALGGHMKALSGVAKGEMAANEATVVHAMAVGEIANTVTLLFPAGSGGGDSRALPEIWSDWAGFEKAADALAAAAPGLVEAAKSGDQGKIGAALGMAGKACGGCHKPFRAEKKS